MNLISNLGLLITLTFLANVGCSEARTVVCYMDSESGNRIGYARFTVEDLKEALPFCTHLIYGYAGLHEEGNKIGYLNSKLDVNAVNSNYKRINDMKKTYPGLKVLLSIGGGADTDKTKYLQMLESQESRTQFVNSAFSYLRVNGFDGLDLAWEFPETEPVRIRNIFGKAWNGFKSIFTSSKIDKYADKHRDQFVQLVNHLKIAFNPDRLILTLSVMPNVNQSLYYDVPRLINTVDQVHLLNFDYFTPERNPEIADHAAPINELEGRNPELNGNAAIQYWLEHGAPPSKLVYGIPTFARTYKMQQRENPTVDPIPPLYASINGPGEPGPYTQKAGLLSYGEICTKLRVPPFGAGRSAVTEYRKIPDLSKRTGPVVYREANKTHDGIWISYSDPEYVIEKTAFARFKTLAGIAICDITLDDFRGMCTGSKYPLLKAASSNAMYGRYSNRYIKQ